MEFRYLLDHIGERRHNRYAVVVFLPEPLEEVVAPWRERFDPIYNLVSPHLTLVFPFDSDRPLEDLVTALRTETRDQAAIRIELSSIGDFYPNDPVIYWGVRDNEELTDFHFRLNVRLGIAPPHEKYAPHITVAREISHHRVHIVKDQIVDYLPDEHFEAQTVDLITPIAGNKWVSVRSFPLVVSESNSGSSK